MLRVWVECGDPELRGQLVEVDSGEVTAARGRGELLSMLDRRLRDLEGDAAPDGRATRLTRSPDAYGTGRQRSGDLSGGTVQA